MPPDHDIDIAPPLFPRSAPALSIEALLAVDTVTLTAADTPPRQLRDFYSGLLGLTYAPSLAHDPGTLRFIHHRRVILMKADHSPGQLALLISGAQFTTALERLRERRVPHELLHSDAGLTRTLLFRDPAGNWIHLLETRPF